MSEINLHVSLFVNLRKIYMSIVGSCWTESENLVFILNKPDNYKMVLVSAIFSAIEWIKIEFFEDIDNPQIFFFLTNKTLK